MAPPLQSTRLATFGFALALITSQSVGAALFALHGLAWCVGLTVARQAQPTAHARSIRSRARPPVALCLAVLMLAVLVVPARAEGITIGGISIGAIIGIFSTVMTILNIIAQLIRGLLLFSLFFIISFSIFFTALNAFRTADNALHITAFLTRVLDSARQCEPEDPDHGAYREEKFKNDRRRNALDPRQVLDMMSPEALINAINAVTGGRTPFQLVTAVLEPGTASLNSLSRTLDTLLVPSGPRKTYAEHRADLLALIVS